MIQPHESTYTQAEAYEPMEQATLELIAVLPDFPGFEIRSWAETPCSHHGIDNSDYTNIEIRYSFSEEISKTALVGETYLEVLREYWNELGRDGARPAAVGAFVMIRAGGGAEQSCRSVSGAQAVRRPVYSVPACPRW